MQRSPSSPSLSATARDSTESPSASGMSTTHAPLSRSPPCDSAREGLHAVDIAAAQASAAVELAADEGSAEELASEEEDSDEPGDSADEDWSSGDATADGEEEEALTGESGKSEADVEEDIGNIMTDFDVQQCVSTLISEDKCERHCLEGKARELEWLVCSVGQMTKGEKTTCILTLIGVLMQTDTSVRRRGAGDREKFHYYLPLVGHVCRPAFASCLGVQPLTIQRYKRRVREGNIAAKMHGNKLNKNASKIDVVWLVKWFTEFAAEVGEVVPVKVRMQKTKDGVVKKYYSRENYTLLSATFTWSALYEEMRKFVNLGLRVSEPAPSTFRKLLSLHCPNVKIRSAQSNVCDLCTIYQARMKRGATAEQTEELGQHTESARRMRREYKKDKAAATDSESGVAVVVMDFSQNLTIPSVTTTPSQWYFCSLLAVNVFGIYYENGGTQTNYLYDEFSSGKGSDQINSILHHFIRTVLVPAGTKHLVVYADNCSGQNKNNLVIKFFLAQVHMGVLERVDYKFFVKGHTKNSCDRGFGHIRKHVARADCWTMQHVVDAVNGAATSNTTVHIPRKSRFFKSYKPLVTELYKTLLGVQQYQIFTMESSSPGVVQCRKGPDDEPVMQDLRRKVDGIFTEREKVGRMMTYFLEDLSLPPLNAEKMLDLHNKIRKYVPDEFQNDPIYAAPSVAEEDDAKAAKQARRQHRAAMPKTAKENSDRRAATADEGAQATKKQKTVNTQSAVV